MSSSGGSAGFASKKKAYIEVQGDYLDSGFVDEDADVMGKLKRFSGGGGEEEQAARSQQAAKGKRKGRR